ncbi:nucleotidyltransferase domain-containing protein [Metabacillus sp. HB246100]
MKRELSQIKDLLSVVLFGSTARDDGDEFSDVDIFLLVEDITQDRINVIVDKLQNILPYKDIGVSIYTNKIYNQMCLEGSMFIWHLKIEGKIIYSKKDLSLFNNLQPFKNFNKNFITYENLYKQVKNSLNLNGVNNFDLSQLFFICRNICLLTCFRLGHPTFGRLSVFSKLVDILGDSPLDWENYIYLSKWRLNYTRAVGYKIDFPTNVELNNILEQIDKLIILSRKIIEHGGEL